MTSVDVTTSILTASAAIESATFVELKLKNLGIVVVLLLLFVIKLVAVTSVMITVCCNSVVVVVFGLLVVVVVRLVVDSGVLLVGAKFSSPRIQLNSQKVGPRF